MGGQKRNRRKFRAKKISHHWKKVNDPATAKANKRRVYPFHSIKNDLDKLDLADL